MQPKTIKSKINNILKMEANLPFFGKRKLTSIVLKLDEDLKKFSTKDNYIFENGRQPQFFDKKKKINNFLKMEDDLK